MTALISTHAFSTGYAGRPVVHDLELAVDAGEVVCLLGPNGAGKTTTMLGLAGELPALSGEARINGERTTAPLHRRAREGMSYVTEERSVFRGMSARDNLRAGGVSPEDACRLFPELEPRLHVRGGLLSGGEQQMLTLARALARKPKLLLVDELSLGLAPRVVDRLLEAVRTAAKERGTGVLMVEQHARKALRYADRVYALRRGRLVLSATADEALSRISEIEDVYLTGASASDDPRT
jgi:branched-chain amino acid transport system ATP-binding protein